MIASPLQKTSQRTSLGFSITNRGLAAEIRDAEGISSFKFTLDDGSWRNETTCGVSSFLLLKSSALCLSGVWLFGGSFSARIRLSFIFYFFEWLSKGIRLISRVLSNYLLIGQKTDKGPATSKLDAWSHTLCGHFYSMQNAMHLSYTHILHLTKSIMLGLFLLFGETEWGMFMQM